MSEHLDGHEFMYIKTNIKWLFVFKRCRLAIALIFSLIGMGAILYSLFKLNLGIVFV